MNTSLTHPLPRPRSIAARPRPASIVAPSSVAETEERRWLLMLGVPFVLSACFFAATIGTGILWLLAPAMALGPALLILAFVYLGISSDSNGSE
jgi:hypothetical protein